MSKTYQILVGAMHFCGQGLWFFLVSIPLAITIYILLQSIFLIKSVCKKIIIR
jgi:hypothetical protein